MSSNDELDQLRTEICELNAKLKSAVDAQSQAAELGLELLKQRADLEQQIELLQKEYDLSKLELVKTKKSLSQIRDQHKVVTDTELDHERNFLEDSAKLEAEYGLKINSLESEVRSLQEQLSAYKSEAERLQNNFSANEERLSQLEDERKELKKELKYLKSRDKSLQNEYNELEEENVNLQKQVSNLKSAQVELEVMKMEISRLIEDTVLLQAAAEEANKLRSIAEKQEQEALASAQAEREQRFWLKREYERLHNDQHLSTLNHLIFGIENNNTQDAQSNTLKQLESSMISETSFESSPFKSGGGQDLFSEIQGELSEKVSLLELEKEELSNKLLCQQKLFFQIISPLFFKFSIELKDDGDFNSNLKNAVETIFLRIDDHFSKSDSSENIEKKKFDQLKADLRQAILLGGFKNAKLNEAHDHMIGLALALYRFYSEIASHNEDNDSRKKVGDIMQKFKSIAESNLEKEESLNQTAESSESILLKKDIVDDDQDVADSLRLYTIDISRSIITEKFQNELNSKLSGTVQVLNESDLRGKLLHGETDDLYQIFDFLYELVRLVKSAAETTVESKIAMVDKDKAELYQTNIKLKGLLGIKREQVYSLRKVIRHNKTSTENALQCLRDKYEFEKKLKNESMELLRKELKQFREDAATFASHRALFTARCEELQGQYEIAQQSLKATEDEKRTLNQLLRMAIHQKIELTQRVEDLEMERERLTQNWAGSKRLNLKQQNNQSSNTATTGGSRYHSSSNNASQQMSRGGEMTRTVRYPQSNSLNNANNGSRSAR